MKNRTFVDYNASYELTKVTSKKLKRLLLIEGIVFILLGFLLIQSDEVIGIIFIICGGLLSFLMLFFWKVFLKMIVNKQNKSMKLLKENVVNEYTFTEANIIIETFKNEANIGKSACEYKYLFKVVNTKEYLFLFISKVQAYVVKKDGMIQGTIDEVIKTLRENVEKYIDLTGKDKH